MLIDYLPKVVKQITEIKEICKAEQPEFDHINTEIELLEKNVHISTGDEISIIRFEKEFGITPLPDQTLEERRIAILIRNIRKNLSLREITNIMHRYSEEIELIADYDADELKVIVGDSANNIPTIYRSLDEIIALNIFILFAYECEVKCKVEDFVKEVKLRAKVEWKENKKQHTKTKLSTEVHTEECFDLSIHKSKDLCYLDGLLFLDGSRTLDAEIIKEEI